MGIVVCVVFCSQEHHPHHEIDNHNDLRCWLIANGKEVCIAPALRGTPRVISSNLWVLYLCPQWYTDHSTKLLWEFDANGFSQIGIRIKTHCSRFEVKKCGLRMVYKKDIEDLNQTRAQCSNNSITPYEGLDFLHHNFINSTMVAKGSKVKRSRVMTMMGLDQVEKEALMMYHTQKGFKGSQNL